jgi:hypothetical protein
MLFWLSGVLLGTLFSTVGMADYLHTHPESVLGRWVKPPIQVDEATEAEFAPPAVAVDVPETPEEPAPKATETPAPKPAPKEDEFEEDVLQLFLEPLPAPVLPPAAETQNQLPIELFVQSADDVDVADEAFIILTESGPQVTVKTEVLPIMPALVVDQEPVKEAEVKVAVEDQPDTEDCDEIVYPLAVTIGDALYDCIKICVSELMAICDDDSEEVEEAEVKQAVMTDDEPKHDNMALSIRIEIESGRFAIEVHCGPKEPAADAAKPAALDQPKTKTVENAEALEGAYVPEALPLPYGPEFPAEDMKDQPDADESCLPGHEPVCPYCGKWFGCDQPATDAPPMQFDAEADVSIDVCPDCGELEDVDIDASTGEDTFDLLWHLDGIELI